VIVGPDELALNGLSLKLGDYALDGDAHLDLRRTSARVDGRLVLPGKSGPGIPPIRIALETADFAPLLDRIGSAPLKLTLDAADSTAALDGRLNLTGAAEFEGALGIRSRDVARLSPLLAARIPDSGAFNLDSQARLAPDAVRLSGLSGDLGVVAYQGELAVELGSGRPKVSGTLELDDVPLLAADRASEPSDRQQPARRAGILGWLRGLFTPGPPAEGKFFPVATIPTASTLPADIDLTLTARRFETANGTFRNVRLHLGVGGTGLILDPVDFELHGGRFAGTLRVDAAGGGAPRVDMTQEVDGFDVGAMLATGPEPALVTGELEGKLRISGTGADLPTLLAGANGQFQLLMSQGSMAGRGLDLWARGLLEQALPDPNRPQRTQVDCAMVGFDIASGIAKTESLFLDSDYVVLRGSGTIDLGAETLDMAVAPRPKRSALLSLATPVSLTGSLVAPTVRAQRAGLLRRGLGLALAAVNPVALVAVFGSFGEGDGHPCAVSIQEAGGK
jgi:hypothetical protein